MSANLTTTVTIKVESTIITAIVTTFTIECSITGIEAQETRSSISLLIITVMARHSNSTNSMLLNKSLWPKNHGKTNKPKLNNDQRIDMITDSTHLRLLWEPSLIRMVSTPMHLKWKCTNHLISKRVVAVTKELASLKSPNRSTISQNMIHEKTFRWTLNLKKVKHKRWTKCWNPQGSTITKWWRKSPKRNMYRLSQIQALTLMNKISRSSYFASFRRRHPKR